MTRGFAVTAGKIFIQFAFKLEGLNTGALVQPLNNSGANPAAQLEVSAAGALIVKDRNATAYTSAAGLVVPNVWYSCAMRIDVGNATGSFDVWLNVPSSGGSATFSGTGDFKGGGTTAKCDAVKFIATGVNWRVQDILVYDDQGGGTWASYLGDKRIRALLPDGDSSTGWTPDSGGNNYSRVNDTFGSPYVANGDSSYVKATSGAGADLYTFANLPSGTGGIVGVVLEQEMRKTDAGDPGAVTQRMRASSTNVDGSAINTTTTYQIYQHFSKDVPGSTGWSESDVNGLLAGQVI
jgi:hypothetical protein